MPALVLCYVRTRFAINAINADIDLLKVLQTSLSPNYKTPSVANNQSNHCPRVRGEVFTAARARVVSGKKRARVHSVYKVLLVQGLAAFRVFAAGAAPTFSSTRATANNSVQRKGRNIFTNNVSITARDASSPPGYVDWRYGRR